MMKTYKHKTLGHIAIDREDGFYKVLDVLDNFISSIPNWTVEDSQDREEVVERNWIEICVDEIFEHQRGRPGDEPDYVSVRKIIEKHTPKERKITMEEIREATSSIDYNAGYGMMEWIRCFLKGKGLLEE